MLPSWNAVLLADLPLTDGNATLTTATEYCRQHGLPVDNWKVTVQQAITHFTQGEKVRANAAKVSLVVLLMVA
jgi:hypothetical protein